MLSLSCVSACEFSFIFLGGFEYYFLLCCELFWEMMPKIETEAPALLNYYLHVSLIPKPSWFAIN